jgi:hypothetical protein
MVIGVLELVNAFGAGRRRADVVPIGQLAAGLDAVGLVGRQRRKEERLKAEARPLRGLIMKETPENRENARFANLFSHKLFHQEFLRRLKAELE